MSRRNRIALTGLAVVVSVAAIALIANRPPAVPVDVAFTAVDRTAIENDHGGRCLDRTVLAAGWADVCWAVDRIPDGSDNTQDYYTLRVYGSFEGVKWLVARADLVGEPDGGAYAIWPKYPIEGSCHVVNVHLGPTIGAEPTEEVCGRTEGDLDVYVWVQTATWTCEQCLLPDSATKPLSMYANVAVKAGTIPSWDVSVGGGS